MSSELNESSHISIDRMKRCEWCKRSDKIHATLQGQVDRLEKDLFKERQINNKKTINSKLSNNNKKL